VRCTRGASGSTVDGAGVGGCGLGDLGVPGGDEEVGVHMEM